MSDRDSRGTGDRGQRASGGNPSRRASGGESSRRASGGESSRRVSGGESGRSIETGAHSRNDISRRRAIEAERRRQKARRTRMLVAMAACVLAVVAGIAIWRGVAASKSDAVGSQDVAAQATQQATDASASIAASTTGDAGSASGTAAAGAAAATTAAASSTVAADRSDFAVDPNRTSDWHMSSTEEKIVYLTFDDGPSYNTQKVLDILDQYGCKATFFVTYINPDYVGMIKKCYDDGMTIGLHTYSHEYDQVYASADAYYADLDAIGQVVAGQIGYVPCFIRFPGGSSNTVSAEYTEGIMGYLSQDVISKGYQYWDWNLSCGDGAEHTADELVYYATEDDPEASNFTNIVMLMHDADGKDTSVEALPRIIQYYQAKGYTFKALDRSSFVSHQGINN